MSIMLRQKYSAVMSVTAGSMHYLNTALIPIEMFHRPLKLGAPQTWQREPLLIPEVQQRAIRFSSEEAGGMPENSLKRGDENVECLMRFKDRR